MAKSFIEIPTDSHFPIENLPYGVFSTRTRAPRIGVAVGDLIFDLFEAEKSGMFKGVTDLPDYTLSESSLNRLMSCGSVSWKSLRRRIQGLLCEPDSPLLVGSQLDYKYFVKQSEAVMLPPANIGDYTDFYSSLEHATNVGTIFRGKDSALHPNWRHLPVGYHGRASSIVTGNGFLRRPSGQLSPGNGKPPIFGATEKLDFELETAFFIGPGNQLGQRIPIEFAEDHIFGMVLMNDWSARDIQQWEYVPLGPFLGKNFCTTISPWVVTMEALEPFRTRQPSQTPAPLTYLTQQGHHAFDIHLEVAIKPSGGNKFTRVCTSNLKYLYWTMSQQLAHHTVNGCNLRPGDLLGSGTISGPAHDSRGCLLELTEGGLKTILLDDGVERTWLLDGDTVKISGYAQGNGHTVGFGEIVTTILPAETIT